MPDDMMTKQHFFYYLQLLLKRWMKSRASSRNAMSVHWIYRLSIWSESALQWHSIWNHSTDGVCFLNTVDHACTLLEYVKVLSRGKWSKNCTASLWKLWLRQDFVLVIPVWKQPGTNFTADLLFKGKLPLWSPFIVNLLHQIHPESRMLNHTDKLLSETFPFWFFSSFRNALFSTTWNIMSQMKFFKHECIVGLVNMRHVSLLQKQETALLCVPFELRSWNFRVPSRKFQLEPSLKSDFRLWKSWEPHQPRSQNPIWLLRASTYVKAVVMYCLLALLSYLCVIAHIRPTVQPLSVDMLLWCLYAQNNTYCIVIN